MKTRKDKAIESLERAIIAEYIEHELDIGISLVPGGIDVYDISGRAGRTVKRITIETWAFDLADCYNGEGGYRADIKKLSRHWAALKRAEDTLQHAIHQLQEAEDIAARE